jgi:hypothetical protein
MSSPSSNGLLSGGMALIEERRVFGRGPWWERNIEDPSCSSRPHNSRTAGALAGGFWRPAAGTRLGLAPVGGGAGDGNRTRIAAWKTAPSAVVTGV